MEPRPNVAKKPQAIPEAPLARPETRLESRFSIEALEERIAPKKGWGGDPLPPEPY
jgi:hypothetical protein